MSYVRYPRLSPSGAKRWVSCPVSPWLEANTPKRDSVYSEEGTNAARLGELKWRRYLQLNYPHDELQQALTDTEADSATDLWMDAVAELTEGCRCIFAEPEWRLSIPYAGGALVGTADFAGVYRRPDNELVFIISDLKYGVGVPVYPKGNYQLMLYALGLIDFVSLTEDIRDTDSVFLQIAQVRLDGGIRTHQTTVGDVRQWFEQVIVPALARVDTATADDAVPGEWCQFCDAAPVCRVRGERALATLGLDSAILSPTDMAEVLTYAHDVRGFLTAVENRALTDALRGDPPPGWALSRGGGQRIVTDHEQAAELLREAGFTDVCKPVELRLKTFGELDKMVGGRTRLAEVLGNALGQTAGKLKLVTEDQADADRSFRAQQDFSD